jgi:superfamily II DNA helicase RecQ
MQRFVCYCLRVAAAGREANRWGWDVENDSSVDSDDEEAGRSETERLWLEVHDLCIWRGNQRDLLHAVWQSLLHRDQTDQISTMIWLFEGFIFQTVGDQPFSSPMIHFLAVLGIDIDRNRLRRAEDFSYVLAGVVYCVRVVGVEILLPSSQRSDQGTQDRESFLEKRRQFLADGSYSVTSTMLSLLAYGKAIALNAGNEGLVHWSPDRTSFTLRGRQLMIPRWKQMVQGVVDEVERWLWEEVMWTGAADRLVNLLDMIVDDVTFTRRGISFVSKSSNGLSRGLEWMIHRMQKSLSGRQMRQNGQWNTRLVRQYLRRIETFLEMLLFSVHTTAGQPARGTEITSVRFRNGFLQDRNLYVIDGRVVLITRYHKSQSQFDTPKVIPRFLPWRVGQLLAVYLGYVQPFREHLLVEIEGGGWSDYVWSGPHGPWETERLTRIITRETTNRLGERLTTLDYRHAAISIGRVFVGATFASGFQDEIGEIDEPEVEVEDGLEISAGRTEKIGVQRYGVPSDIVKHLSMRSMETFRPLSEAWHRFLGLASSEKEERRRLAGFHVGQKRPREDEAKVIRPVQRLHGSTPTVSAPLSVDVDSEAMRRAMQKALGQTTVSFRSPEQKEAMAAILAGRTPLVVILPTGGGKSLLFMAPACLDDAGVTIVVVPFRALVDDLLQRLSRTGIDCLEWTYGEVNAASIVVVSADVAGDWRFLDYASLLVRQQHLRRVVIDECHLAFTSSDYRPKLAHLKRLRSLHCPTVLLTATLPPVLEVDLSESLLVPLAQYIRAVTVRKNTRYAIHWCPSGQDVATTAVSLIRRQTERLRGQRGVVYCRTRAVCEALAEDLGCLFYHAGHAEKTAQLEQWLDAGGFIVTTSALGTGVDYPGIVMVIHVGVPYGMIDFAQESGRAGRQGQTVDSVVVVGAAEVLALSRQTRSPDQDAMVAFLETPGCRRGVMSRYLDGSETLCTDGDLVRCDRCGDGAVDWQRSQMEAGHRWQMVESVLQALTDGCPHCWVSQAGDDVHLHSLQDCAVQAKLSAETLDGFRRLIRYEVRSHSCTKCGISQHFCATGQEHGRRCQWPNVLVPVVRAAMGDPCGFAVVERVGYTGAYRDWTAYGQWLGQRHRRRYWGEWMSNGMVVLIEIILYILGR